MEGSTKAESAADLSKSSLYDGRIGKINPRYRLGGAKPSEKQETLMPATDGGLSHPRQSTNALSKKRFPETMPDFYFRMPN